MREAGKAPSLEVKQKSIRNNLKDFTKRLGILVLNVEMGTNLYFYQFNGVFSGEVIEILHWW